MFVTRLERLTWASKFFGRGRSDETEALTSCSRCSPSWRGIGQRGDRHHHPWRDCHRLRRRRRALSLRRHPRAGISTRRSGSCSARRETTVEQSWIGAPATSSFLATARRTSSRSSPPRGSSRQRHSGASGDDAVLASCLARAVQRGSARPRSGYPVTMEAFDPFDASLGTTTLVASSASATISFAAPSIAKVVVDFDGPLSAW